MQGTNQLAGNQPSEILDAAKRVLRGDWQGGRIPEKWNGRAAERIVEALAALP